MDAGELLLAAGADVNAPNDLGWTPLHQADHDELVDLRVAAGLGRPDLIERLVDGGGRLTAEAFAGRGFYRPHRGFPVWRPSNDPQEVLDEALVWACRSGSLETVPRLVALGARVDADPYRGTPLIWAAVNGRIETLAWLLEHGADVNQRATFGGPSHGEGVTALHLAAQNGDLATVRFLVERGADPTIEDAGYHSSPLGWAAHFERNDVRRYLEEPPA